MGIPLEKTNFLESSWGAVQLYFQTRSMVPLALFCARLKDKDSSRMQTHVIGNPKKNLHVNSDEDTVIVLSSKVPEELKATGEQKVKTRNKRGKRPAVQKETKQADEQKPARQGSSFNFAHMETKIQEAEKLPGQA